MYSKKTSESIKKTLEIKLEHKNLKSKIKKLQILWGLALYFLITCIGTE